MNRAMKDSNVDWLGQIPAHWNLKRAKFVFKQSSSKGNTNLVLLSATQDRGVVDKSTLEGVVQVAENADLSTFKTVHINDFVISLRSFQGGFEISHCEGVISPAYTVFRLREGDYVGYYKHLFKSIGFIDKINSLTVGIREGKNIQYEDFSNMLIPVLSIPEQQSIADFLDKKCGEIDEMVSLQEKIVEELKAYKQSVITEAVCKGLNPDVPMKDSGIEWIGQIPEGWRAKRLKFSCEVFGRIGFRGYTTDDIVADGEGAITLSPSNMKEMTMDFSKRTYLSWNKYKESPEIMVYEGDVLMVKTGSSYGKCSFVDSLPMESTINPQIVVFKKHKDNAKYIAYYFQTPMALAFIKTSVVGGTIPTIAQEKIMNYYFAFPPREEQNAIVDYLDTKCAEIDALISLKQSKIEALKEYKKSTIYEYITGKKELNG